MSNKYDRDAGYEKEFKVVKQDLQKALCQLGLDPKGSAKKLQAMVKVNNIPTKVKRKVVREGWMGKPKGAIQILNERGWIDPKQIHLYTKKGCSKDGTGSNTLSILKLMSMQEDFWDEVTLLQFHTHILGVTLDHSPKCHPEVAGEGIEYLWALAKLQYCRSSFSLKRNKESFIKLLYSCLDNETVLNLQRAQSCSRRARQYMLMYKAVASMNESGDDGIEDTSLVKTHSVLESSIKLFRQLQKKTTKHRGVLDHQVTDIRVLEKE